MSGNSFVLASGNITIGTHRSVWHVAGLTIYGDVVWTTLIAAAIVLGFGLRMRAKVTSGVPGKLQLFWETLVEQVSDLASSAIGPEGLPFVGLGVLIAAALAVLVAWRQRAVWVLGLTAVLATIGVYALILPLLLTVPKRLIATADGELIAER